MQNMESKGPEVSAKETTACLLSTEISQIMLGKNTPENKHHTKHITEIPVMSVPKQIYFHHFETFDAVDST